MGRSLTAAATKVKDGASTTTADSTNRIRDKATVEEIVSFAEQGIADAKKHSQRDPKRLIVTGYERSVYGDHWPYFGFLIDDQIEWGSFPTQSNEVATHITMRHIRKPHRKTLPTKEERCGWTQPARRHMQCQKFSEREGTQITSSSSFTCQLLMPPKPRHQEIQCRSWNMTKSLKLRHQGKPTSWPIWLCNPVKPPLLPNLLLSPKGIAKQFATNKCTKHG